jgi:hypothetical protein
MRAPLQLQYNRLDALRFSNEERESSSWSFLSEICINRSTQNMIAIVEIRPDIDDKTFLVNLIVQIWTMYKWEMYAWPIPTILKVRFPFFMRILKVRKKHLNNFFKRGRAVLPMWNADKMADKQKSWWGVGWYPTKRCEKAIPESVDSSPKVQQSNESILWRVYIYWFWCFHDLWEQFPTAIFDFYVVPRRNGWSDSGGQDQDC